MGMNHYAPRALASVALAFALAAPASALDSCAVGQKVLTPGGKVATVIEVNGSACKVEQDGTGWTGTWAAFMLEAAPGGAAGGGDDDGGDGGAIAAGDYQCHGGNAGNLRLTFLGGGRYANGQGESGSYEIDGDGQLTFTSGPWQGFYGRALSGGRVGLSSRPDTRSFTMTCEPD